MSEQITNKDVETVLDAHKHFSMGFSEEDLIALEKLKAIKGIFNEEQAKEFKCITFNNIVNSKADMFKDELWSAPKKHAEQMLKELDDE